MRGRPRREGSLGLSTLNWDGDQHLQGGTDGLVETELRIKRALRRSPVIHADETALRVNKRLQYVHTASTPAGGRVSEGACLNTPLP
jgi:hypothetical protein